MVTRDEAKEYLRVDYPDDDALIDALVAAAERLVADVARADGADGLPFPSSARVAVLYATAYLYEHREEADHNELALTLRSLLSGQRREAF